MNIVTDVFHIAVNSVFFVSTDEEVRGTLIRNGDSHPRANPVNICLYLNKLLTTQFLVSTTTCCAVNLNIQVFTKKSHQVLGFEQSACTSVNALVTSFVASPARQSVVIGSSLIHPLK